MLFTFDDPVIVPLLTKLFLLVGCEINDLRCNCFGVCFLPIGDLNTIVGYVSTVVMSVAVVVIAGLRCGRTNPGLRHDVSAKHHRDSDLDVVIELELSQTRFRLLVGGGVECKAASFDFLPGVVR